MKWDLPRDIRRMNGVVISSRPSLPWRGEWDPIPKWSKNGEKPGSLVLSKNLDEILIGPKTESCRVWSIGENGWAEWFERRSILGNEVAVVAKERDQAHGKHGCHKEYKEDMELLAPSPAPIPIPSPKFNKVGQGKEENDEAVEKGIDQEEDKKLVVVETDAVVYLQDTINQSMNIIYTCPAHSRSKVKRSWSPFDVWFD